MIRVLLGITAVAALAYTAWLALLYFQQRQLLFAGANMAVSAADALPDDAERLWLDTTGDRVEAWLLPAPADTARPAPAIVFAHGNGEIIDQLGDDFRPLQAAGLHVLLVEYPGYGRSEGRPTQASVTAAFVAAYDRLAKRHDTNARRIVGMGRSLGGGAIMALARERTLSAIVLQSTFTSVTDIAGDYWAPASLVRDPFDNLAALRRYAGPVLLGHGRRDRIIAYRHGRELAAAAGVALTTWDCSHNDCPPDWRSYLNSVIAFLRANGVLAG